MIATPSGEVAVEHLKIGDMIATADGRAVRVKWLGEQRLRNSMIHACPHGASVHAGARWVRGCRTADLYVSGIMGLDDRRPGDQRGGAA